MQRECEQCGIRSGDLPDLGLEEDEEDVFFEVVKGVTLCAGCAQYPMLFIGPHECTNDFYDVVGQAYCECGDRVDIWEDERYN